MTLYVPPTTPTTVPPRHLPKVGDCVRKQLAHQYAVAPCSGANAGQVLKRIDGAIGHVLMGGTGPVDLTLTGCPADTDGVLSMSVPVSPVHFSVDDQAYFCINTKA
jgi:hypothetical protein